MSDALIEITRHELVNAISKIFSALPSDTQLNISKGELARTLDSLFKIKEAKKIVPIQTDGECLCSDLYKELSNNALFEYVTLEEAAIDTNLKIKYLLRGALQGKYLLYHYHGGWWPVPVMDVAELYNGKEKISSKIWSISDDGSWLPNQLSFIEPIDKKWGKESEVVQKVPLTIASLHIMEEDLRKIINNSSSEMNKSNISEEITNNSSMIANQFLSIPIQHEYEPPLLKIAVECWKALYEDAGPDGRRIRKSQIEEWLQENYTELSANSRKIIAAIVNPFKSGGATPSL